MKHYFNQHIQALRLVFTQMRQHFLATLVMFVVIGVTFTLPAMLYVVVDNLNRLANQITSEPQITLFMRLDADSAQLHQVESSLKKNAAVDHFNFVGKEMAWQTMMDREPAKEVTSQLENNPLPDAFFVFPKTVEASALQTLRAELQSLPGVEIAQMDADWVNRLNAYLKLATQAIKVIALLLGFMLLMIIGNTIRLQIATQRDEIEVSQLIGATPAFIRRPFVYAGAVYGFGGGIASCVMLYGIIRFFNQSIGDIAKLYGSDFILAMPPLPVLLTLFSTAIILGWLAAFIVVSRDMAQRAS